MNENAIVLPLKSVGLDDLEMVGGKNASLGEMLQNLTEAGINIPNGFVITVEAYRRFIAFNHLDQQIKDMMKEVEVTNIESLRRGGLRIRQLIQNSRFPPEFSAEIIEAYKGLSAEYDQEFTDVAVRSSATAEDLPDASFAGQQETYLNVRGPVSVMDCVRNCFASLFTDRAISYRESFGYDHFSIGLSVCVQKMVRSDLGASGVAFSIDTESGFKNTVLINASFGLGEMIVQGSVSPDEYMVFKPTMKKGFASIIEKKAGSKDVMMVYGDDPDERVKVIPTDKSLRSRFCLKDETILKLANWVTDIETYYSKRKGKWTPMDVEWGIDGISRELFILQARPETIHSRKNQEKLVEYVIADETRGEKLILEGIAVGDKMASGAVSIMYSMDKRISEGNEFRTGDVLVTDMTDPDWEPIMKKASAIITNKGGRTCHAAIVAREMGIPAIVGCGNATTLLSEGQFITASCAEGSVGYIYEGEIPFNTKETDISEIPETKTKVMLNVASPSMAFQFSHLPNKGVGLAREEFIINNYIKAHPLALLNHKTLNDPELTASIQQLMVGFDSEEDFFIQKLSFGIARIASAFYPEKVIVRFSDFKTNEYYNLLGGKYYEPSEENPMIGWRGASRYYSKSYKEAFGLECKAIDNVRNNLGLDNVVVMVPFCRTIDELQKVQGVMKEYGLERGKDGLEIYLMAEIPANIILAEDFAKHIDGFSIGSNDLTQLALGIDRDSSLVAHLYDEMNPAVQEMIRMVIRKAKAAGVKVGICGQGPSDNPEFAKFLVEEGIDSVSVTPDSLVKTVNAIAEIEKVLGK